MKYDRSRIVAFLFILLSVGSSIYVSAAGLNYLNLYPALDQIRVEQSFQVDMLVFAPPGVSDRAALTALITVKNPSGYWGFRLASVAVTIFFFVQANRNTTLFGSPDNLYATQLSGSPLPPASTYSINLPVGLTRDQAGNLTAFNGAYPGHLMGEVGLRIDIITFLESVTGTVPFTRTQDVSLSSN